MPTYAETVLSDNPYAYYDGDSSGTTALDRSGNGLNLAPVSGMSTGTGNLFSSVTAVANHSEAGTHSLLCNDTNLIMESAAGFFQPTGDYSVEFWYKSLPGHTDQSYSYDGIRNFFNVSKPGVVTGYDFKRITMNENYVALPTEYLEPGFNVRYANGNYPLKNFTAEYDTGWHHVALVKSGNDLILYTNGAQNGTPYTSTVANQVLPQDPTSKLYVFGNPAEADPAEDTYIPFIGHIDQLAFYEHALSAARIADRVQAVTPAGGTLNTPYVADVTMNVFQQNIVTRG